MREIYTVGHSTRGTDDFLRVLKAYDIEAVADVRHFPGSKKFPWFSKDSLIAFLKENGIDYVWIEELGGFRKGGYEAYMKTDEWMTGMERLIDLASKRRIAIMCAEVLWWRCHRRFVSDWLLEHGWKVHHIFDEKKVQEHNLLEHEDSKIFCDKGK